MSAMLNASFRAIGSQIKNTAKASPFLTRMAYNFWNASHFSNLYEHEQLLGDSGRCDAFAKAILKHIKPGDTVIDVGTGTGVLAMLAARVEGTHVYALDHSDFVTIAEKVAHSNGIKNITFVKTNSQNFKLDKKVDVILHEQIGDDLFEENMVHNLLDLKQRLLKPDGIILPGRFQLFIEPVVLHPDFHTPMIDEINVHGLDFSVLKDEAEAANLIPADYEWRYMNPRGFQTCLSDPVPAIDFDLNKINSGSDIPSEIELSRTFTSDGHMAGFGIWFNIVFDDEINLSTSPFARHTHWAHRFYRTPSVQARAGETLDYKLTIPDLLRALTWKIEM